MWLQCMLSSSTNPELLTGHSSSQLLVEHGKKTTELKGIVKLGCGFWSGLCFGVFVLFFFSLSLFFLIYIYFNLCD